MVQNVKKINEDLDEIRKDAAEIGLVSTSLQHEDNAQKVWRDLDRETDSFLDKFVGRDDDVFAVMEKLTSLTKQHVLSLPEKMRNLVSLRHLHFNDPELVPAEVRFLTRLQTLSVFVVGPDHMVEELGCLNELKGELKIYKLEQVRDKEEAGKAKLCEKRMDRLVLEWSDEGNNSVNYEGALEGLQPHPDLRSLTIQGYGGEKFPSWMSTLQLNNLM
ncbi:NBS-LRR TYPE DISEASE RESISTANCE PROTEIN, partial [Salix purpurea]